MVRSIVTISENFSGSQKNFLNCEIHSFVTFHFENFQLYQKETEKDFWDNFEGSNFRLNE